MSDVTGESPGVGTGVEETPWQCAERRAAVAIDEVFRWLGGAELARAGAVCRLWHEMAACPAMWRRLVLRGENEVHSSSGAPRDRQRPRPWRQQYVCAHAPWDRAGRARIGVLALHGALSARGDRLALAAADASVSVWEQASANDTYAERWRCDLRESRGWRSAARVQWAADGRRLLAAGPLVLAAVGSSWELLVLQFDEWGTGSIVSRARCGAGAAGCWASAAGDAYLSLEPVRLAPGLAVTSVWLNAATQEMQSEYAGVAHRLFRIYNEDDTHLSHTAVVETAHLGAVLVAAWGGGRGGALGSWPLVRPHPPSLEARAGGSLPTRLHAMRERALLPDPEPPEPDEATVRAQCKAPLSRQALLAAPVGCIVSDCPGEPRLWVSTSDGAIACFSTPDLVPLRQLAPPAVVAPLALHYVQPAVSEDYVASPQGSLSGGVCVWATRGGGRDGARLLSHGAPAGVTLLPPGWPPALLVLAGEELHVWRSRATPQPLRLVVESSTFSK